MDFSNFDLELDEDGDGERPMTGTRSEAVDTDSEGDGECDVDDDGEKQEEERRLKLTHMLVDMRVLLKYLQKQLRVLMRHLGILTNEGARENVYLELPKLDVDKVIIPNEEIHQKCHERLVEAQRKAVRARKKEVKC